VGDFTLQKRDLPLAKVELELAQHLANLRRVAPDSAKFVAQRMFGDTMVQGVGNKLAYADFAGRTRPGGVHVMVDGNDFGAINKQWGQSTGDDAIKAMGGALSRASRANRGKLFRVGGDEFRAHFDTPEQAHAFSRHARKELEALPPVQGVHHHSVSIGIAADPHGAEHALIAAKNAKKAAGYAPGHALTHAHSLLPGAAGPVPVVPRMPEVPVRPAAAAASPVQGPAFQAPLARSEFPELAEARLRKAQGDMLAKMSLIHTGPQPMPVWRVEDEDGHGPYRSGVMDGESFDDVRRPHPNGDFTPEEAKRNWTGEARYGFLAPEHAEAWFGPERLSALRARGFVIRRVMAQKVWNSKSGKQVMFEPHGGEPVSVPAPQVAAPPPRVSPKQTVRPAAPPPVAKSEPQVIVVQQPSPPANPYADMQDMAREELRAALKDMVEPLVKAIEVATSRPPAAAPEPSIIPVVVDTQVDKVAEAVVRSLAPVLQSLGRPRISGVEMVRDAEGRVVGMKPIEAPAAAAEPEKK
jgi:GGDEF domain-containing protein